MVDPDAFGRPAKAAWLYGAHEAIIESIGASIQLGDLAQYERGLAAVTPLMDDEEFGKLWAEGRRLSIDEAAALVFSEEP